MTVDLLVATSGLDARRVLDAVPPGCRRPIVSLAPVEVDDAGGEALLASPTWAPRAPAMHLLPSFALLTDAQWSGRFELSARVGDRWSPWVGAVSLGPARFDPIPEATDSVACDVDVFVARRPVEAVRLRVRLRAGDVRALLHAPWLLTLSAAGAGDDASVAPAAPDVAGEAVGLPVPPLSQQGEDPAIAMRVCSPTSVAMVMNFWGRRVDVSTMAAEIYHPGVDRYGVWPAAIRAAARHGLAGYLLRFPDWASAAWCLRQGLPVIASVRYDTGELTGAAIAATTGHLIVLTGYDDGMVLANDPAADVSTVSRRYRLDELRRAWLTRSGVGYVLFSP